MSCSRAVVAGVFSWQFILGRTEYAFVFGPAAFCYKRVNVLHGGAFWFSHQAGAFVSWQRISARKAARPFRG
eukprot:15481940-Alexandrium_andersonii.AAC.1